MSRIKDQYLSVIRDTVTADTGNYGEYGGQNRESQEEAATDCEQITKQEMENFDKWKNKNNYLSSWIYDDFGYIKIGFNTRHTFEQLFELYLIETVPVGY